jgi:hypothetical protein
MADRYQCKMDALFDGSLTPAGFSHADHIGVAYESLRAYDFMEAIRCLSRGIRARCVQLDAQKTL